MFLASCGVLVQLLVFGSIPIVAIALALTFGFYGLVRKKINLEAVAGLFIETLVLLPVAAIYLGFIADTPTSQLSHNSWSQSISDPYMWPILYGSYRQDHIVYSPYNV